VRESAVSHIPQSVEDRAWEPIVATHPTDPNRIAVVYQHRGPGTACSLNPIIRISHDGGRSWRSTKRSPAARSGRGLDLHAAIAWGPGPSGASRLYWTDMTTPGCGDARFSLSTAYSDNEGDTWSALHVERRTPPWVGGFPEIAVDRDPASPDYGTVYVGYNWLPGGARGPGFRLLASADFGQTWRSTDIAPAPSPRGYSDWWRIAYRLRTSPDGGVYASWYQVDLRRWDRTRIFAKGGPRNVGRLGVAVARVDFDRATKKFHVGRSRIATTVPETAFTTSGGSAPGTAGNIRPDPMWQQGFDVDQATGRLYVAVATYGAASDRRPRGTIRVGHSDDAGETWSFSLLPSAPDVGGHHQSSIKPNLVAGPGYVLVTFHTLDDVRSWATVGSAYTFSTDGGATWRTPAPVSKARWRAENLGGVVNGIGLRERAERLADGDVFWAYGDGRFARGSAAGRLAIFGALLHVKASTRPPS
jgi:BNR/Asp-box repeat.